MSLAVASIIAVMRERGIAEPDILAVVEAAVSGEKRSAGAIRQARYRERKKVTTVTSDVTGDVTGDVTESPQVSPKDIIKPLSFPQSSLRSVNIRAREVLDRFWAIYPKRTNRKATLAKLETALKAGVDPEKILAGAARYADHVKFTEPQFIKAPDAWLNAGKWDDELPADPPRQQPRGSPRSAGDGMAVVTRKLREQINGQQSSSELKDITPTAPESRAGDSAAQLHESAGKLSGGGKILDFGPTSPDLRRSATFGSEAARTFDWTGSDWERG